MRVGTGWQRRHPLGQERLVAGHPVFEVQRDQRILGAEAVVERLLGGAGGLGDQVDADGADAAPVEQLGRGREQALACGGE